MLVDPEENGAGRQQQVPVAPGHGEAHQHSPRSAVGDPEAAPEGGEAVLGKRLEHCHLTLDTHALTGRHAGQALSERLTALLAPEPTPGEHHSQAPVAKKAPEQPARLLGPLVDASGQDAAQGTGARALPHHLRAGSISGNHCDTIHSLPPA